MDLYKFIEEYKRKYGRHLDIQTLLRAMNGPVDTFNDSGTHGSRGYGNLFEQRFWEMNSPTGLGDMDRKDPQTGEFTDYNLMYNRLNDLYRIDPTKHREAQKRILDQGLGNDMEYQKYRMGNRNIM